MSAVLRKKIVQAMVTCRVVGLGAGNGAAMGHPGELRDEDSPPPNRLRPNSGGERQIVLEKMLMRSSGTPGGAPARPRRAAREDGMKQPRAIHSGCWPATGA